MTKPKFSLVDLVPEPLTFEDTDGTTYDVLTANLFGAKTHAHLLRLQAQLDDAQKRLRETQDDAALADAFENIVDAMLTAIIPSLPAERRGQIAFAHKLAFLTWWKDQQPAPAAVGEVAARRLTPP